MHLQASLPFSKASRAPPIGFHCLGYSRLLSYLFYDGSEVRHAEIMIDPRLQTRLSSIHPLQEHLLERLCPRRLDDDLDSSDDLVLRLVYRLAMNAGLGPDLERDFGGSPEVD